MNDPTQDSSQAASQEPTATLPASSANDAPRLGKRELPSWTVSRSTRGSEKQESQGGSKKPEPKGGSELPEPKGGSRRKNQRRT